MGGERGAWSRAGLALGRAGVCRGDHGCSQTVAPALPLAPAEARGPAATMLTAEARRQMKASSGFSVLAALRIILGQPEQWNGCISWRCGTQKGEREKSWKDVSFRNLRKWGKSNKLCDISAFSFLPEEACQAFLLGGDPLQVIPPWVHTAMGMQVVSRKKWLWLFVTRRQERPRKVESCDLSRFTKQISCCCCSVAKSWPTLCDPMDRSTPGFPVRHHLPEFAHTHICWVGDAIQSSHPLSPPSPPAFNLSQLQGLFQWVGSLHQVAKVLELQLQHQFFQWIFRS